jgi:Bacterial regulatory helix-turn-helix protein, lysR family
MLLAQAFGLAWERWRGGDRTEGSCDGANLRVFLWNCLKSGVTDEEAPAASGTLHLIASSPGSVEIADGCVSRRKIEASLEEVRSAPSGWTCAVMRMTRVAAFPLAANQRARPSTIRNIELDTVFQTLVVAEQGSFHKAASLLGVKTSTLSRRIYELEARIGVSLFQRHRHGVRPTDAGRIFLRNMQRIESDLDSVLVNARALAQRSPGSVSC